MHVKSVEKLATSKEMENSSSSMEEDDVTDTDDNGGGETFLESKGRIKAEFLTFSAPEEDENEDEEKIENLLELLKPRRILLVEAPENTKIIGLDTTSKENDELAKALLFSGNTTTEEF